MPLTGFSVKVNGSVQRDRHRRGHAGHRTNKGANDHAQTQEANILPGGKQHESLLENIRHGSDPLQKEGQHPCRDRNQRDLQKEEIQRQRHEHRKRQDQF